MEILAIIPARGGSKGIPLKNIQKLAGKPLLEYTIESAKNSKKINKIVVSTDSLKISKLAKLCGAEIPFLRPKNISGSKSSTIDAIKHTLKYFSNQYVPDIVVILQPTSPFRTPKMIDTAIRLLEKSNATSVVSVSKGKLHPYQSYFYEDNFLKHFKNNREKKYYQRQQLPDLFYENGTVYAFWNKTLQKFDSIYGPRIKPLVAKKDEIHVDIDNKFDLFVSEMILMHWKKYQQKFKKS